MRTAHESTIFYCDSMNTNDIEREETQIPANLMTVVNKVGETCTHHRHWNQHVQVLMVSRQEKCHHDCGLLVCVNEIARAFSHDPESFMSGEIDVNFESLSLRCGQAAVLLKWLHHDCCT